MEFATVKKSKKRKRKRNNNKRRVQRKLEVKAASRRKIYSHTVTAVKDESRMMEGYSFWQNYKVAQDWQQKHSVAWWKSRCYALQYENHILRQKLRDPTSNPRQQVPSHNVEQKSKVTENGENSEDYEDDNGDDENLEFQVDKEMLDFLEQSIRHKMERKQLRESEIEAGNEEANADTPFVSGDARMRAKMEDARLLYGKASPGIMAMEAALQATVDNHKDRAKPHYWPNIPLKP